MTYPSEPARGGMPPWAKWTLIGCGGCMVVAVLATVLGGVAIWQLVGKNMKFEMLDVSRKPDPPLTASAGQLLPPKVGAFVRQKIARASPQKAGAGTASGWQGSYTSAGKRVDLTVIPTREAQAARSERSPFGGALRQQQNPNSAVYMSIKAGPQPMDMVVWSKPNWTYMIQSPGMVAKQFATAYQPAVGGGK
jgi:hypothetical protein